MRPFLLLLFFVLSILIACNPYRQLPDAGVEKDWRVKEIPATPQSNGGDPAKGLDYLIYGDFIGTGIPYEMVQKILKRDAPDTVLHREGENAEVNHKFTVFTAQNGIKVMNGNCFTCHSSELNGEVVLGLGDSFSNFQKSLKFQASMANTLVKVKYGKKSPEWAAFEPFGRNYKILVPWIITPNFGINPAFRLEEAVAKHRNPIDLTYQEEPNYKMIKPTIASDVPPLWNVRKKNALYYNGMGQGDFTKMLIQAALLGIPDTSSARKSQENFVDVVAWLKSLQPPAFPAKVDRELAKKGSALFIKKCSKCHGTYGDNESYPNKLVSLDVVKTDPFYARLMQTSGLPKWYNKSWFAQSPPYSRMNPEEGYVAPPLDGIWATAPYLHNGSVPTIEALLNSPIRPKYWSRTKDSKNYNYKSLGWKYTPRTDGNGKWTYDTTIPGYSNQGHYFGDKLSNEERMGVIEYLKTL